MSSCSPAPALIVAGVLWNVRGEAQRNGRIAALPRGGTIIQPAE